MPDTDLVFNAYSVEHPSLSRTGFTTNLEVAKAWCLKGATVCPLHWPAPPVTDSAKSWVEARANLRRAQAECLVAELDAREVSPSSFNTPGVVAASLPVDERCLEQGDPAALLAAVVSLAAGWFARCGSSIAVRHDLVVLDAVMQPDPQQRALLAAACDLVDLVAKTPQGRQALRDLGLEPVFQYVERE